MEQCTALRVSWGVAFENVFAGRRARLRTRGRTENDVQNLGIGELGWAEKTSVNNRENMNNIGGT